MQHQESSFKGYEGVTLFYQSWHPEGESKAVLMIIHGLGEHGGRYPNVVNHLVPKGYAIYALDHRGHGRSERAGAAHVLAWQEFREDVRAFHQLVAEKEAGKPLFVLGHSMGGLITLNYLQHHQEGVQGAIISAPAVGKLDVPAVIDFISGILSGIAPAFAVPTNLDSTAISRDAAVVKAYQNDPFVHGKGTPRFATELKKTAAETMANAGKISLPLLMIHGDQDKLVNVANTRAFFPKVSSADKELIIYEGGYHESHNDIHHEQVTADLERWLEAHL
ncbi:MAG: lysophospholipase [Anaerolineales bacterium]|nr:lysophospholipase [Anaerolineales bacterium]